MSVEKELEASVTINSDDKGQHIINTILRLSQIFEFTAAYSIFLKLKM